MFKGKVAIVTGTSRGIGMSIALEFAKEGANIVISARKKKDLAETAKACRAEGVEVLEVALDLLKMETLGSLIDKTVEKFSKIDFLISNAGMYMTSPVEEVSLDSFDHIFRLNVYAPFFLSQAALPYLKKTKGCIVNISSVAGLKIAPDIVSYGMSKSALDAFSRGLSIETAKDYVRVNSINPAAVNTDMFSSLPEEKKKPYFQRQPMGIVNPQEIAKGVLFICSSSHLTGATLPIDAGYCNCTTPTKT